MIFLTLFVTFFKIGLFSFGGGYGMIPLIQHELMVHQWMTAEQFVDIIAIAEMTPGPIAVNAATYVGFLVAGFNGGLVATLGVATPSVLLILFLAGFFFKHRSHPLQKSIFHCIRPAVTGLIAAATITIAGTALLKVSEGGDHWAAVLSNPFSVLDLTGIGLFSLYLLLLGKLKMHPVLLVGIAAGMGMILYALLPALFPGIPIGVV